MVSEEELKWESIWRVCMVEHIWEGVECINGRVYKVNRQHKKVCFYIILQAKRKNKK